MNNENYPHLIDNLKKRVEKVCNKYGYVDKVFNIISAQQGIIHPENMMGFAMCKVKYACRLCLPIEKKKIICQVEKMNKMLILAKNGPIEALITTNRMNENVFSRDIKGNIIHKATKSLLKPKDFVIVGVLNRGFDTGDTRIRVFGYLEDAANDKQIKQFYADQHGVEYESEEQTASEDQEDQRDQEDTEDQ
jgi:DNA-directed RNA polymerase subunit E'/Rpb7